MSKTSTMGEVEDLDQFEYQNLYFCRLRQPHPLGWFWYSQQSSPPIGCKTNSTASSRIAATNPPVPHHPQHTHVICAKSHTMFSCADARPVHTARRLHTTTHYARGFHSITFYRVLHCRCGTTVGMTLIFTIFETSMSRSYLQAISNFCNMHIKMPRP